MSIEFNDKSNKQMAESADESPITSAFHEELNKTIMDPIGLSDGDRVTQAAVALVQQALVDKSLKDQMSGQIRISADHADKVEITNLPTGKEFVRSERRGSRSDGSSMIAYYEDRDIVSDRDGKQLFSIDELDSGNVFKSRVVTGYFDTCQQTISGKDGQLLNGFLKGVSLVPQDPLPDDGRFKESVFHATDDKGTDLMTELVVVGKITGSDSASVTATLITTDKDGNPLFWAPENNGTTVVPDKDGNPVTVKTEGEQKPKILGTIECDLNLDPNDAQGANYKLKRDGMLD